MDMQFITPIYLVHMDIETDDAGDTTEKETKRKVLANKKSIGTSEYYQAHAIGMKPEIKLEIRSFEYKNEKKVIVDGVYFNIIRTFENRTGYIELTLEGDVHGIT